MKRFWAAPAIFVACAAIGLVSYGLERHLAPGNSLFGFRRSKPSYPVRYGSLRWRIQQAKAKGEQQLQIGRIIDYGSEFRRPDDALGEALSYFAVIVAIPIEKKSYEDQDEINSWYRFKLVETLNPKPTSDCPGCINPGEPPADLVPRDENEILVAQAGGTMVIDGLKVIDLSSKPYTLGQKYLMFLRLDPKRRTAVVTMGPVACSLSIVTNCLNLLQRSQTRSRNSS